MEPISESETEQESESHTPQWFNQTDSGRD